MFYIAQDRRMCSEVGEILWTKQKKKSVFL